MTSETRFSYEWQKYNKLLPQYKEQFDKWTSLLPREFFKDKTILDAGCGMGRNTYYCLKLGAKKVTAFDCDLGTINAAKKNLEEFKNAEVIKESIYDINYKNEFDLAMCIGVIHHLEDPKLAVNNLIKATKPGGKILLWVYGYEGNEWIVKYINPIRKITSRLPIFLTHLIAYKFSIPLYIYIKLFPQKKPYFQQLKEFKFSHIHSIVFDQLLPKIANYCTEQEARELLNHKDTEEIQIMQINQNSWCVVATKK